MKDRKVVCFLILALIVTGCVGLRNSQILFRAGGRGRFQRSYISSGYFTLGSRYYTDEITQIELNSGYNAALHRIMADVDKHGSNIDTNDYNTNLRLYKLVSYLVYKTGNVSKDVHYFRNKLNRTPNTLNDLLYINSKLPLSRRWRLLSVGNSMYHMQGNDGIYNLKFVSADGFCEAVYNKNGILLTEKNDPVNMGTFNYAAGIREFNAHQRYDIAPYLIWGNTPDSPQKGAAAINAGIKQVVQQYNEHSASVDAYRKKIMSSYTLRKT